MSDPPNNAAPLYGKPGWLDWLSRIIARTVYRLPRFAPSRFKQKSLLPIWDELDGEPFVVQSSDGVEIHAVRCMGKPPKDGVERLPIVFAHGWTEVKEYHHRLARLLTSRGHEFVIYDQRAHGQSKAKFSTLGVREPDDLAAVIDGAIQRGWLGRRFILMGVSMGGATVLRQAARDRRVAGVVAYAPFASFVEANQTFKQRVFRFAGSDWVTRGAIGAAERWGFDIRESAPVNCVAEIDAPMLYIVGANDRHLPAEHHTQKLAAVTDSEVVIVPGANHFNICYLAWPEADDAMLAFVDQVSRHVARREADDETTGDNHPAESCNELVNEH